MSEPQEEYSYQCPYCSSVVSLIIDLTAGVEQSYTVDCEVCCRPAVITITLDDEGIATFDAEREMS